MTRPVSPTGSRLDLRTGLADIVAVGRLALANPGLPERCAGRRTQQTDPMTFYGGDEHGYTDYPSLTSRTATQQARHDERWCQERPFAGTDASYSDVLVPARNPDDFNYPECGRAAMSAMVSLSTISFRWATDRDQG